MDKVIKKLCLHLACGTVYLKNFINIDIVQEGAYFAKDRPDLVKENGTDLQHYYKTRVAKKDFMKGTFHDREVVMDKRANVMSLPYECDSVDAIVAIQVFEHFTYLDGEEILDHWCDILKKGGTLQIHVPDIEGIVKHYIKDNDINWLARQFYGSQKNEYNLHKAGYTKESLTNALLKAGFKSVEVLPNIHTYPSVCLLAKK